MKRRDGLGADNNERNIFFFIVRKYIYVYQTEIKVLQIKH